YRLRALLAEPDFSLKVAADRFALVPGQPLDIAVTVERRNGFSGDVEMAAVGLPKGVTAEVVADGKGIVVRLPGAGEAVSGSFRIVGTIKGKQEPARIAQVVLAEYGVATSELWLTMGPNATAPKDAPPKKKKG